jgi:hypothetical protein
MSRVNRGERLLERLIKANKLTEEGCAAVIAAVDPFHDKPIEHLKGWPDLESQPSLIRAVKCSATVKATVEGGAIVVQTWPLLSTSTTARCSSRNNNVIGDVEDSASTNVQLGGCTVTMYNATGTFTTASKTGFAALGPDDQQGEPAAGESFLGAKTRLIGMGVEVHDVTAEIYKQGTCTVVQIPQSQRQDQVFVKNTQIDGVTYASTAFAGRDVCHHPTTLADAMLFEGTRQWEAKDGAYVVVPFSTESNPPTEVEYCNPVLNISPREQEKLYTENTGDVNIPLWITQPDDSHFVWFPNRWAPVHSKVIYLTGLNVNAAFQINVVYYLETFPDASTIGLITLARPSACYDPLALKMISCAMQELPVGVPVDENWLGDWFLDVVETVAPIAGELIGGFFGGPGGAVAGGAVGTALSQTAKKARGNQQIAPPASFAPVPKRPVNSNLGMQKRPKQRKKKQLPKLNRSQL